MGFESRRQHFTEMAGDRIRQRLPEATICYDVISALKPDVFLEIGSMRGGTFYVYSGACEPNALVVSVEKGQFPEPLERIVEELRSEGYSATWIKGNSHSAATLKLVKRLLGERQVGILHIDGDHTAKGVMKDWLMYWPLVKKGGIAAVHDIYFAHRSTRVCDVWPTIREQGSAWCEIVGPFWKDTKLRVGIGIVWK